MTSYVWEYSGAAVPQSNWERFHWEISSSMKERIIRFNWGTKRGNFHFFFGQRERKMAENRGICAAHTCIPQYREHPPSGGSYASFRYGLSTRIVIELCLWKGSFELNIL